RCGLWNDRRADTWAIRILEPVHFPSGYVCLCLRDPEPRPVWIRSRATARCVGHCAAPGGVGDCCPQRRLRGGVLVAAPGCELLGTAKKAVAGSWLTYVALPIVGYLIFTLFMTQLPGGKLGVIL